jgi:hypothetical protein
MRSLARLLESADGRAFLETHGVALSAEGFIGELRPPANPGLADLLRVDPGVHLVYVAHQTHADLKRSVISKFRAARDLRGPSPTSVVLWLDMDRAGSDRAATTITWPFPGQARSIRLVPQRLRDLEPRFVPVEDARLQEIVAQVGTWIEETVTDQPRRVEAHERLGRLARALLAEPAGSLARANAAIAGSLLGEHLSFRPPSAFVSDLASAGLLTGALNDALDNLDDLIVVFNRAVEDLVSMDVDPQVHSVADDYLPLNYSCDRCGARRRLRHERAGLDHFAAMICTCGGDHRFHLGSRSLSLGELESTGRWSTDVSLPVYLNDMASGVVVGQSSALYGLVLRQVVEKVLGRRAVPMLVPEDLYAVLRDESGTDSVLFEYLTGT